MPVKHQINGVWTAFTPFIVPTTQPVILNSQLDIEWSYKTPENLLNSGVYTAEDITAYQRRMAYPLESGAVQNAITREALGYPQSDDIIHFENFLTERTLETILEKTTKRAWGLFHEFGTITSGLIGIIFVIKMIKIILYTILFGKLLYSIFGFSYKILACFCDTLAHYFIHNHHVNTHASKQVSLEEPSLPSSSSAPIELPIYKSR